MNDGVTTSSSKKQLSSYQLFPWLLPSGEHKTLIADVENLLVEEGVFSIISGTSINKKSEIHSTDSEMMGHYTVISSMSASYVRLWLSLREIQFKEPHAKIAKAVSLVIQYVHSQV